MSLGENRVHFIELMGPCDFPNYKMNHFLPLCLFSLHKQSNQDIIDSLISLHISSMWETICDAWACWSGWNFGPNSTEYPYSEIQFQNTPPPRKWKLSEILGLWLFSFRIPPPPKKLKFRQILALWLFSFRIPPPPPENWNLGRSWHFKIFQFHNN